MRRPDWLPSCQDDNCRGCLVLYDFFRNSNSPSNLREVCDDLKDSKSPALSSAEGKAHSFVTALHFPFQDLNTWSHLYNVKHINKIYYFIFKK